MDVNSGRRRVFERIVYPDADSTVSRKPVFKRLVYHRPTSQVTEICRFWVEGRCNRNPCRFLHSQSHLQPQQKRPNFDLDDQSGVPICRKRPVTISKNEVLDVTVKSGEVVVKPKSERLTEMRVYSGMDDPNPRNRKRPITITKYEVFDVTVNSDEVVVRPSSTKLTEVVMNSDVDDSNPRIKQVTIEDSDDAVAKSVEAEVVVNFREPQIHPPSTSSVDQNSEVIIRKEDHRRPDSVAKSSEAEVVVNSIEPQNQPPNSDFVDQNSEVIIKKEEDMRQDSVNFAPVVNSHLEPQSEPPKSSSDHQNCREGVQNDDTTQPTAKKKVCEHWISNNCAHGEKCKDLHSWVTGTGFSHMANLERRHKKTITGVCLPSGMNKLCSASEDGTICFWDCISGQCIHTIEIGCQIGCLMATAPWVFVGREKGVNVWNTDTNTEFTLDGVNSVVRCLFGADDMLFGGMDDGSIAVWKSTTLTATLTGHKLAVLCFTVRAGCLYSASEDGTIRIWDVKTLKCLHLVNAHAAPVTSVLCWNNYLMSSSLDNTIRVWAISKDGNLEVAYQVGEESGVLALSLIHNSILVCSCANKTVRLYNIPSFTEQGTIFSKEAVKTIVIGCSGLIFTGDHSGQLDVWQFPELPREGAEKF